MFKKGKRIRINNNYPDSFMRGKTGVIVKVLKHNYYPYTVKPDGDIRTIILAKKETEPINKQLEFYWA